VIEFSQSLVESARLGSGLGTVYRALDELVELYALEDAAVVVDVPGLGRQVLNAGRRPLGNDERGLHDASPGLYLFPALNDPVLNDMMVALGSLGLRFDVRPEPGTHHPLADLPADTPVGGGATEGSR
jgi:D-serine deaminase-like pyridoxal phosphate-dependent protein